MKEKSCLKVSALLEPNTFKTKINELLLVNFLDLETIQLIVIRKKFFFDLDFKNDKVWNFFLVSDKIVFHNCGHREDIEYYYKLQTLEVVWNYTLENELNTSVQFLQKCSNVRICMTLSDKRFKRSLHKFLFLHEYNRKNMFLLSIFLCLLWDVLAHAALP